MDMAGRSSASYAGSKLHDTVQDKVSSITPGGKRLHPRVILPLRVRVREQWHWALDWSLGGLAIDGDHAALSIGDVVFSEVRLTLDELDVSFEAACQLIHSAPGRRSGFKFCSLTREQAGLLFRVIEDHLAGHVTPVAGAISLKLGSVVSSPTNRPLRVRLRSYGLVTALSVAALGLLTVITSSLLTVRSQIAAVAMDGWIMRAPLTGLLGGTALPIGSRVTAGQMLFRVSSPAEARQIINASAQLKQQQRVLGSRKVRLQELRGLTFRLTSYAEANVASIRAQLVAADAQITASRAIMTRSQTLLQQGVTSRQQLDTHQIQLQQLQAARQAVEVQLGAAQRNLDLLRTGTLRPDIQDGSQTETTMLARVEEAEDAVAAAQRTIEALEQTRDVTSPCECVVHAFAAQPGDTVQSGALIYSLRPLSGVPVVDALFEPSQTHELSVGSPVTIALPTGMVGGHLERIQFDEPQTQRLGLPPSIGLTERMAKATIRTDVSLDPAVTGTPARVTMRGNPLPGMMARLGALFAR